MNSELEQHRVAAALSRNDYRTIMELVPAQSRVLDLGCGNGDLLFLLEKRKQVRGYGVELADDAIVACIEKGLSVFQGNIDEGLRDFEDNSFDYVVLNLTLPVTRRPDFVIEEMLRVGAKGVVSFANFAHWRIRLRLFAAGRMPIDEAIPHEWYNTPNIHHLTIRDFAMFCRHFKISILESYYFNNLVRNPVRQDVRLPNLTAGYGLFVVTHR